ncbi:MAG: hypothetical protein E7634_00445 [Ruminococcaceae bacterium]|nr:hypothetical protein [Oscillospiraceae bacterium]
MKRILALTLAVLMLAMCFVACGKTEDPNTDDKNETVEPDYKSALELINKIFTGYNATATEETMLYVVGGNMFNFETCNPEGPAEFVSLADTDYNENLGIAVEDVAKIEGAASMHNMMNANMFTSYVIKVKADADIDALATALKTNILARQWICGAPDKLVIAKAPGNYLIVTWGVSVDGGIVNPYTESFATVVPGSSIVVTETIA